MVKAWTPPALKGASDSAMDFGLTDRALRFAQLRAEHPWWSITHCATEAGYSDQGRAAHVRGCELQRDPRVMRAILYFSSLEVLKAQAETTSQLRWFVDYGHLDGWTVRNLMFDLRLLASRTERLNRVLALGPR